MEASCPKTPAHALARPSNCPAARQLSPLHVRRAIHAADAPTLAPSATAAVAAAAGVAVGRGRSAHGLALLGGASGPQPQLKVECQGGSHAIKLFRKPLSELACTGRGQGRSPLLFQVARWIPFTAGKGVWQARLAAAGVPCGATRCTAWLARSGACAGAVHVVGARLAGPHDHEPWAAYWEQSAKARMPLPACTATRAASPTW